MRVLGVALAIYDPKTFIPAGITVNWVWGGGQEHKVTLFCAYPGMVSGPCPVTSN